jgi:hypothetical protein
MAMNSSPAMMNQAIEIAGPLRWTRIQERRRNAAWRRILAQSPYRKLIASRRRHTVDGSGRA